MLFTIPIYRALLHVLCSSGGNNADDHDDDDGGKVMDVAAND